MTLAINMNIKKPHVVACMVSFALFGLYLESHPGLKNIWIRRDDSGVHRANLRSLLRYTISPIWNWVLWRMEFLDANGLVFVPVVSIILLKSWKYLTTKQ